MAKVRINRLQITGSNTAVITEYLMFNKIPFCHQLSQRSQISTTNRENSKYMQQNTEYIYITGLWGHDERQK